MNNYDLLIQRLDAFIRRYYLNQLMRGGLIFIACLLTSILLLALGEYMLYFPSWFKLSILALLALAGLLSVAIWIIVPLLKINRLGTTISHEQAAAIIGKHFPEVSDKLLNILQLRHNAYGSSDLIEASIQQKSAQISIIPFSQAVDLKKNRRYLPYLAVPAGIILLILLLLPDVFRQASERLMRPAQNFDPPAPFSFHITNQDLQVPLYGDYTLEAEVKGNKLPDKVYVAVGNEQLEMQKIKRNKYAYTFTRVGRSIDFQLKAAAVASSRYKLSVLERPQLETFRVEVHYPAYTGKKNEILSSLSDMTLPAGTVLKWSIEAGYTEQVHLRYGSEPNLLGLQKTGPKTWSTSARFTKDTSYTLLLSGKQMPKADSFRYQVQIIADNHPQVQAIQVQDSITGQQILLSGNASDDYGINRLYFHYTVLDAEKKVIAAKNISLKTSNGNLLPFQHYFDLGSLQLQPGQEVNYFVEAWDNDAVQGPKSARSDVFSYRMPDVKEAEAAMELNARQINQGLNSSADQAKKLQQEMKSLQDQLLQSDGMNWEKQQHLKSMAEQQERLRNQLEAVKKRFEEQKKHSELKNYSEEIKEKQAAVEKQLDNLLNKELAEQLKKLQEMMKEMNKENTFNNLQQMEQRNKLFNMDMERIQELMRKLEMQMKMEDLGNKLEDLARRENELQQNTEESKKQNAELIQDQKDIQNDLKQALQQDMKDIERLNDKQQKPEKLDNAKELGKEAEQSMQEGNNELQKNQKQKASQAQNKARQNLQQMAAAMKQMAAGMDAEQIEIDIKATRQILTNLIRFSFDQEKLLQTVKRTPVSSPAYVSNSREQNRLKNNAKMIKDSLFTLSKRVFQIAATVNKETSDLEANIQSTLTALEHRRLSEAISRQQFAMTSANNLALLLNELLENLLQNQAQAQSSGDGSCSKPGGMNPKPGKGGSAGQMMKDIITGQEELGKNMQKGKGKQPGASEQPGKDGKEGGQSGKGGQNGEGNEGSDGEGNSEQLARMAQQQAALRRQIQELSSMLNSKGMSGQSKEIRAIQEEMDKNETDLVNRRLNSTLIERQKQIMTRLLEAEKAIRDQEEDDKRNARAGRDEQRPMPPELRQYLQSRQSLLDLYKTAPPALKPYYRKMAEDYLKQVKQPL